MIFNENSLRIIAESFGWPEPEIRTFIGVHTKKIYDVTAKETFAYLAEHDPEKMQELNDLLESDNQEDQIRGFKASQDQVKLLITTYPDLQDKIDKIIKEFETEILFNYLQDGPTDGILKLLDYIKEHVQKIDKYLEILEIAQKRAGKSQVEAVLNSQ